MQEHKPGTPEGVKNEIINNFDLERKAILSISHSDGRLEIVSHITKMKRTTIIAGSMNAALNGLSPFSKFIIICKALVEYTISI